MKTDVLIGIDAGTSVIKAVAFSTDGDALALCSRENSYQNLPNGGVEQDMRRTWEDTAAVLEQLIAEHPELGERVVGLAVTGQGDGTWLVDADGEPVHDAWLWLDSRGAEQAREIAASEAYQSVYSLTGTGVNVCQMRTHFHWMQQHEPELLERAASSFHCKDYLYFKLTGERAADPSEAVFTFGSFASRDYDDTVIEALGLSAHRHLLPPVVDGIEQSHPLDADVAKRVGLKPGLPVTLGYVDVICSALGGGLYDKDVSPGLSIVGSTGMHMKWLPSASEVTLNAEQSGYTMCFPGGSYAQMQSNMAATLNIDWWLDVACEAISMAGYQSSRAELLKRMDDHVEAVPPGSLLYHPYISHAGERGPFTEPMARASFTGLHRSSGYANMMRAIYEGLAFAARDCFDAMGESPDEIRVSGGASRSRMLREILAAVLNRPLRIAECDEAGAAGACMIAATQLGIYPDLAACCERWVNTRLGERQLPDTELGEHYEQLFPTYQCTRLALQENWQSLAAIRSRQVPHA